jgi:hypothetical protein
MWEEREEESPRDGSDKRIVWTDSGGVEEKNEGRTEQLGKVYEKVGIEGVEAVKGEIGGGGVVKEVVEGCNDKREIEDGKSEGWTGTEVGCCVQEDGEEGCDG